MGFDIFAAVQVATLLVGFAAIAYLVLAIACVLAFPTARRPVNRELPPLTLLKPVCGSEPGLAECLRSFYEQDYPGVLQVVFGARLVTDAGLAVARQVAAEYPHVDTSFVVDATVHGPNLKGSNLVNMSRSIRHDLIAISDSDAYAARDTLKLLAAAMNEPGIGAATCAFRGRPAPGTGLVGQVGRLFIDGWFLPSAIVDATFSGARSCFGPLTIIRRDVFSAAGGFERLTRVLADDTELGHMTAEGGYRVAYGPLAVDTTVPETAFPALFSHELRWARTTRALRPAGYVASVVTHALPVVLAGLVLSPSVALGFVAGAILSLRALLLAAVEHRFGRADTASAAGPWHLLFREVTYFGVWVAGFCGRRIEWKGRTLQIVGEAEIRETARRAPDAPCSEVVERAS